MPKFYGYSDSYHFQNVGKPGLRVQYLTSGFPCGAILFLRQHLAMSGDIPGCHNWGVTTSRWVGARNADKYPKMHRTSLKELCSSKYH